MRTLRLLLGTLILISWATAQEHKPIDGRVPDAATAVKVAKAVLVPVYGKKQIESEEPFSATLKDDVWTVEGTLHCPGGGLCFGGAAVVKISKTNGRVISMYHPK